MLAYCPNITPEKKYILSSDFKCFVIYNFIDLLSTAFFKTLISISKFKDNPSTFRITHEMSP